MAAKKTPKKRPKVGAKSRVTFNTRANPRGSDWYQAGPLWLQSTGFSQTDPFKETMSPSSAQRVKQAKRQSARALKLLARARRRD